MHHLNLVFPSILIFCVGVQSFKIPGIKNSPFDIFNNNPNGNDAKAGNIKDANCGIQKLTPTESYRISTPLANYGLPSPAGYSCTWEFYGTEECNPVISCDPFTLQESVNCSTGAYLEITDGYSVYERYCGNKPPVSVTTGSSLMQTVFNSKLSTLSRFTCIVSCAAKANDAVYTAVTKPLQPPATAACKCGVPGESSTTTPGRIVGGKPAKPLFWKWQASLVPKTRKNPFCGASLISDRFALTAAHCVVTTGLVGFPAAADIVLNDYDFKNSTETITIRRSILAAFAHPLYNPTSQDYDYALIEFEPVDLTSSVEPKVTPVCLPAKGVRDTYVGVIGTATGWGTTSEGGSQSEILLEAEIPIISNADCNQAYENKITARMLCAAYPEGKIDSCQGDSGGPFVINNNGVYTEVGVVSFGEGCARQGKPGVYARVTEVNDWIHLKTRNSVYCAE